MAFFIVSTGSGLIGSEAMMNNLKELVPYAANEPCEKVSTSSLLAYRFKTRCAIPEITFGPDENGSWMALTGSPLVRFSSAAEVKTFFDDFIRNPSNIAAARLDGSFALLAFDAPNKKTYVVTDYYNSVPVYYAEKDGVLYLSSHELALAKSIGAEIDPLGFSQVINTGFTWDTTTRFKGIAKTTPCELAVFGKTLQPQRSRYWEPEHVEKWKGNLDRMLGAWLPRLKKSVYDYYDISGKPLRVDFTGGEDSRIVLSACHAAGAPFTATVTGPDDDPDVIVSRRAAMQGGFELDVRKTVLPEKDELLREALSVTIQTDGYDILFRGIRVRATDRVHPFDRYSNAHLPGLPGGEVFRGAYYPRARMLSPESNGVMDLRFFFGIKFMMDYSNGLVNYPDDECIQSIFSTAKRELDDVRGFSMGTQVDHIERFFQSVPIYSWYKVPVAIPLGSRSMTHSVYSLPARYKAEGKIVKAATEILFPEISRVRVVSGVPTIRKTWWRLPLFFPEYKALTIKAVNGILARRLKIAGKPRVTYFQQNYNRNIIVSFFNNPPFDQWFKSPEAMATGHLFNPDLLSRILEEARTGDCKRIPLLGRIISAELSARWVAGKV